MVSQVAIPSSSGLPVPITGSLPLARSSRGRRDSLERTEITEAGRLPARAAGAARGLLTRRTARPRQLAHASSRSTRPRAGARDGWRMVGHSQCGRHGHVRRRSPAPQGAGVGDIEMPRCLQQKLPCGLRSRPRVRREAAPVPKGSSPTPYTLSAGTGRCAAHGSPAATHGEAATTRACEFSLHSPPRVARDRCRAVTSRR